MEGKWDPCKPEILRNCNFEQAFRTFGETYYFLAGANVALSCLVAHGDGRTGFLNVGSHVLDARDPLVMR